MPTALARARLARSLLARSLQACVLLAVATPLSAGLPKVQVAADKAGFVTADGKPFVPFGVNYFRPGTGWAPQVWTKFDPEATRKDFALLKARGVNVVRVFLTWGSFYNRPGALDKEGLEKFDKFLALAEEARLYVHPTGPDHWEGRPQWVTDSFADPAVLAALEQFWTAFAARYKGRGALFAYDLLNEPYVGWDTPAMRKRWEAIHPGLAVPASKDAPADKVLLDYQRFREGLADEWTRRQAAAIKAADPAALVTVGLIQWSVPAKSMAPSLYAAFHPARQAKFLDFMEVHFYPLATGAYRYESDAARDANLAYLESVVREVARPGLPVVVAEFGWYGGGGLPSGREGPEGPAATEEQQADWCEAAVRTTTPLACGWLNWGAFDVPEARDCSRHSGLLRPDGSDKAWAGRFHTLAQGFAAQPPRRRGLGPRPDLPWDACITNSRSGEEFRRQYLEAFLKSAAAR